MVADSQDIHILGELHFHTPNYAILTNSYPSPKKTGYEFVSCQSLGYEFVSYHFLGYENVRYHQLVDLIILIPAERLKSYTRGCLHYTSHCRYPRAWLFSLAVTRIANRC